jgi:hypothetical protein
MECGVMPREQINFPQPVETQYGSCDGKGNSEQHVEVNTDPAVHVNWHNAGNDHGGHVQVSLECDRAYLASFTDVLDDDRRNLYSPVLTRSDVNKLIRTLRKARDQAYGRDE